MAKTAKTYTVQSPLEHDQVLYDVGSEIQLDDEVATPLVERGILSVAPVTDAKK